MNECGLAKQETRMPDRIDRTRNAKHRMVMEILVSCFSNITEVIKLGYTTAVAVEQCIQDMRKYSFSQK